MAKTRLAKQGHIQERKLNKRFVDIALAIDTQDLRWKEMKRHQISNPIKLGVIGQNTGDKAADRRALANTIRDMLQEQADKAHDRSFNGPEREE